MPKETKLFVLVHILIVLTIAPVTQMYNTFSELCFINSIQENLALL